ncbi:unnamed protein product [Caenorhabditis auriculariae]|uniref:Uncharacterized protein n=1 Tax=Caenorhabditis auriculariae TaxID=2777116 RepID=A0A8S1GTM4_9PELO|nr:unnamed protein product [Caenorhabditis auriculariae]
MAALSAGYQQPANMSTSDIRSVISCTTPVSGLLSKAASATRIPPTPNAFGEKTYVSKEDHERERSRWHTRLDDIEKRLVESETINSEMLIIKAELNKKIVDMERNQKPLIEQNRKLGDRNKNLQQEIRKVEQKFCHSQDDFLTLKDAHERILKENLALKEKRTSPEKLEELDRYRNQVLEYSKCITALRSSGLEKDRRYEMLVQKFKRLRKCLKKGENDDDKASTVGSDCSAASSVSLDTITEDFEEALEKDIQTNYQALYRENAELQRALNELRITSADLSEESILREQISFAHTTIAQQQILIDANQEMMSQAAQLKSTVMNQQEKIRDLEHQIEEMNHRLAAQKDTNDLLEFQVLEMEENSRQDVQPDKNDKSSETEENFEKPEFSLEDVDYESAEQIAQLKQKLSGLRKASNLTLEQCKIVARADNYISHLENRIETSAGEISKCNTELSDAASSIADQKLLNEKLRAEVAQLENKTGVQQKKLEEYEIQVKELQVQITALAEDNKKIGETDSLRKQIADFDGQKQNLNSELKTLSKELGKTRFSLQGKESDLEKERKMTDALSSQLQQLVRSSQEEANRKEEEIQKLRASIQEKETVIEESEKKKQSMRLEYDQLKKEYEDFKAEQRPGIRTELERRFEETRFSSKLPKKAEDNGKTQRAIRKKELIELKEFNAHLERQFQSQTDIIEVLKNKIVQHKSFSDLVNKLAEMGDPERIHEELVDYSRDHDKEEYKLASNIAYIIKEARKGSYYAPLEISTAHHKIRPYNSVDSSGEWLSNSSEGIVSPDEHEGEEWNSKTKASAQEPCNNLSASTHST